MISSEGKLKGQQRGDSCETKTWSGREAWVDEHRGSHIGKDQGQMCGHRASRWSIGQGAGYGSSLLITCIFFCKIRSKGTVKRWEEV